VSCPCNGVGGMPRVPRLLGSIGLNQTAGIKRAALLPKPSKSNIKKIQLFYFEPNYTKHRWSCMLHSSFSPSWPCHSLGLWQMPLQLPTPDSTSRLLLQSMMRVLLLAETVSLPVSSPNRLTCTQFLPY
jgi:hypothetical protein